MKMWAPSLRSLGQPRSAQRGFGCAEELGGEQVPFSSQSALGSCARMQEVGLTLGFHLVLLGPCSQLDLPSEWRLLAPCREIL